MTLLCSRMAVYSVFVCVPPLMCQFDLAGSARMEVLISVIEPRQASQVVKELTEVLPLEQAKVSGTLCLVTNHHHYYHIYWQRLTDVGSHGLRGRTAKQQQAKDPLHKCLCMHHHLDFDINSTRSCHHAVSARGSIC